MIDSIDKAIIQIESLSKVLKRNHSNRVQSLDEKGLVKATALSWFRNWRLELNLDNVIFSNADNIYKFLLEACEKRTERSIYIKQLNSLKNELIKIRSENIVNISLQTNQNNIPDISPNFNPLIQDEKMISILKNRWEECVKCIVANSPLSSVVMMGGILEAILLAKINTYPDKAIIFKLKSAPIDKKTSKVLPLHDWTLKNYIEISHEIGWITQSVKNVGEVLRDYRNYIHPYKEYSHGIKIIKSDAELFWNITKSIIKQVI
jgi:hypothetical protein